MAQYEWAILEVLFLGLLVWELVRVRRSIRVAREEEAKVKEGARGVAAAPPSSAEAVTPPRIS